MKRNSKKFFGLAILALIIWICLGPASSGNDVYVILVWPNPLFILALTLGLLGLVVLQEEWRIALEREQDRNARLKERLRTLNEVHKMCSSMGIKKSA